MGDEFKVNFVKPHLNEENNSLLVKAHEELEKTEYNFKSEWVSHDDCLKADGKGKQIYIFDSFEGPAFQHVKDLGYRTYGPLCILGNLLHGLELPKHKKIPVLNLAMKGVKVCCTSIDRPIRDEITRKVHLMGGEVDPNLTADVTHLIAGEVGSNKYLVAVQNGKVVMTKEWVDAVWEASQDKHISGVEEAFAKYRCPPFLGLTVCVSGFSGSERNKMRGFVIRGGGKYSGELNMNECTHLVVKEPKGAKYEAAKNWKIRIVNDRWLYESMDKEKYMDPKPYQYNVIPQGKDVKTSTPERRSVMGPNISDISAISCGPNLTMQPVDETRDITSTRMSEQFGLAGQHGVADSKLGTTNFDADASKSSVDVVLDGCKIFMSGVKPATEEKLRKIISGSGALKASTIDETITHVIVGDVIASDILHLGKLKKCPHVVSADWLMDSFSKNVHLNEDKYERADLGLMTPTQRKQNQNNKDQAKSGREFSSADVPEDKASENKEVASSDSQDFRLEAPSDMEMAELLSQYSVQQDNASKDPPSQDVTLKAVENMDGMTQDPNAISQEEPTEADCEGIFSGKVFTILGFEEEETVQLREFIIERGGKMEGSSKRQKVADFTIVPLIGCPMDVTSSEILTNAWLQMCIEADEFLPHEEYWLSKPFDLPNEDILTGCIISVSGFMGVEREGITHLCQSMGAKCQEHFARRTNKTVEGSTHLIVNAPTGTKYNAAKKWSIPAVGKEWVIECIKSGHRVTEDDYHIDMVEQKRLEKLHELAAAAMAETSTHSTISTSTLPTPDIPKKTHQPGTPAQVQGQSNSSSNNNHKMTTEVGLDAQGIVNTPTTRQNQNVQDDVNNLADANKGKVEDRVPTSSAESSDSCTKNLVDLNPMAGIRRHLNSTTPGVWDADKSAKLTPGSNSACRPNQSENITAGKLRTPVDMRRQKWGQSSQSPMSTSTPKFGGETPGTFMQPGFRPKFNMDAFCDTSEDSVNLNKSTPLGEVFRRHITKSLQNMETKCQAAQEHGVDDVPNSQCQESEELPPLHGIVIAVAKKLGRSHEKYNQMVVELGGDYSWHSGPHVTHFVFQGRPNDPNKEFRKARDEGKIIVSPHWLIACKEQNCRVDESIFPHSFNPSCSLTLTPARRGTPRSTRAVAKSSSSESQGLKAAVTGTPAVTKAPRKMPVLNLQQAAQEESLEPREKQLDNPGQDVSPGLKTATSSKSLECSVSTPQPDVSVQTPAGPEEGPIGNLSTSDSADRSKNQEMKDALTKTLGTVLAGASRSKRSARRKGKLMNLSGQMSTPDGSLVDNNASNSGTSWAKKTKETNQVPAPEPSQSLQVTWDDPTERLEKEKLAHKLEAVCEPSQSTDEMLAAIVIPDYSSSMQTNTSMNHPPKFAERSPTPEPPPLAFPLAKPTSRVLSPQPVELLSEESSDSRPGNNPKPVPVFLISGMTNEERVEYSALVEQLGGKMVEIQHFDPQATHLVVGQPARNEKYLSCIASGKWVLHKSFFEASRKEGKFVKEDQHEWGGEYTHPLAQNMKTQAMKLAMAAHKWRKKVAALREANPSCQGAFDGWNVLLCMAKNKEDNFRRLLQAGGAQVSTIRPPFSSDIDATHAILDLTKAPLEQDDLEKLIQADIHCLKAEYIPAYLTDEPQPDPSEFYPPEVMSLKASMPEPIPQRKRQKAIGDNTPNSKKARRL